MDKIMRVSLVDEAYKRIKDEIVSKNISEGSKIPSESQLCKELNVSRVVIREALSKLRNEKLIITYQGKGSYLANPNNFIDGINTVEVVDFETFKSIMDFRTGIESCAIKLAIRSADKEQFKEIELLAEKMANNGQDFDQIDYDFHHAIIKASKNALLINAYENCSELIKSTLKTMNLIRDGKNYAVKLHRQIAKALLKRDAKHAIMLIENNEEYNFARLQKILNEI